MDTFKEEQDQLRKLLGGEKFVTKSVTLGNGSELATFFDWASLIEDQNRIDAQLEDMADDDADSFLQRQTLWVTDFHEYFAGSASKKILSGDFLPIAVLGLIEDASSWAELGNTGFLYLAKKGWLSSRAAVFRYRDNKATLVTAEVMPWLASILR